MLARISAFVIWSLVAAAAVFWLLRLTTGSPQAPAYAVAVGKSAVVRGDLNRLFGAPVVVVAAAEPVPEAASRFKLVGVMAPRSKDEQSVAGSGLALIAVDGKPAKAFTVGASLDSGLVVQSVGLRTASIGPARGARSMLLEIPALPPPNTGVLPSSSGGSLSGVPVPSNGGVPQVGSPVPAGTGSTSMRAPPQAGNPATMQASPQFQSTSPPVQSSTGTINPNDPPRAQ